MAFAAAEPEANSGVLSSNGCRASSLLPSLSASTAEAEFPSDVPFGPRSSGRCRRFCQIQCEQEPAALLMVNMKQSSLLCLPAGGAAELIVGPFRCESLTSPPFDTSQMSPTTSTHCKHHNTFHKCAKTRYAAGRNGAGLLAKYPHPRASPEGRAKQNRSQCYGLVAHTSVTPFATAAPSSSEVAAALVPGGSTASSSPLLGLTTGDGATCSAWPRSVSRGVTAWVRLGACTGTRRTWQVALAGKMIWSSTEVGRRGPAHRRAALIDQGWDVLIALNGELYQHLHHAMHQQLLPTCCYRQASVGPCLE